MSYCHLVYASEPLTVSDFRAAIAQLARAGIVDAAFGATELPEIAERAENGRRNGRPTAGLISSESPNAILRDLPTGAGGSSTEPVLVTAWFLDPATHLPWPYFREDEPSYACPECGRVRQEVFGLNPATGERIGIKSRCVWCREPFSKRKWSEAAPVPKASIAFAFDF